MMYCICDTDVPAVFKEDWRTARKQHKCCECGASIALGEHYHFAKGKWDGEWYEYKTCERCADLRKTLSAVWCVSFGNLRVEYLDYLAEIDALEYDEHGNVIKPINHLTKQ